MNFFEEFEKLSTSEKNTFKNTMNNLLFQCFINATRFERTSGIDKTNNDYTFIEKHFSLYEDYLSYMDVSLNKDEAIGIIYCTSDAGKNRIKIDTSTTLLTFVLRAYYEKKLNENPSMRKIAVHSSTLRMLLEQYGLTTAGRKLTALQIATSLRFLSNYNVVMRLDGNFNDTNFSFYILPPIRYIMNSEKLNILYEKLTNTSVSADEDFTDGMFGDDNEN